MGKKRGACKAEKALLHIYVKEITVPVDPAWV
jgi:hypothetical protein